ncbi:MAG: FecR family protein [Gammaproteobacteria bacterium]
MKNLENLTVKYINQQANVQDLELLYEYLKSPENEEIFKFFVRINFYGIYIMNEIDKTDILRAIEKRIASEKRKLKFRTLLLKPIKYAAIALLFLSIGYYYQLSISNNNKAQNQLVKEDQVILKTSTGESFVLNTDEKIAIEEDLNLFKNSRGINYEEAEENLEDEFHELIVPYGKRYNILLSDGSKVYLNSGSYLKYPVVFKENQVRRVELVGEAFFEVSESSDQFVVQSEEVNVEVYGTTFNFKNYREDSFSDVVLVEGSVAMNIGEDTPVYKLNTGHKGSFSKDNKTIFSERVNTKLYTSWINGEIVIRKERFDQIIIKLERIYNVTIINNKPIDDELFNANINPDLETIDEVLEYFKEIYQIKYQIYENKIIIN